MAEQIGNNGNELTLIIPSALEKDWAVSIRDNCFSVISSHDHSGSGAGKKLIAADAIDATSAWLANDTYLLFKDNAGTSTVDVIKATTSDELQFGTTIAVADFQSDGLTVSDATDNTKKLALDLSGITTATTRTLTIPDASDTIALISTAQTFTNKTIDADLNTISNIADAQIKSGAAIALNKLAALTASRAVVSDGSGVLSSSSVTSTELGYVSGVTSAIQTQLNSKQAASSNLDAIAAVATNGGLHRTGAGTYAARTLTGTTNEIDVANGDGVSGNPTVGLADNPVIPGTDSMVVPSGTIAQRVSTTDGSFRFNSELSRFEGYRNSAWSEIGGGAGGINYIDDNDAEAGVGDWATYADAAGENAVDGTGGAATLTFTQNSTTALRGSNDFKFAKDAADRQGEGASYDFSIDNADKSQKLYISFDYDASDANYADDDIRIAVYDVTNANLIRVNGEDLKGGKGKYLGWFQSAADSTSYRLIIHQSSTNAAAYDIYFDNVSVGPREAAYGSAMTDWKEYTPTFTGFGTPTNIKIRYRRNGDSVELQGRFDTGAVTGTPSQITLPTELSVSSIITENAVFGAWNREAADTSDFFLVANGGNNYYQVIQQNTGSLDTPQNVSSIIGSSESQSFYAKIPIEGWSSNALMSEDIGNREVAVSGGVSSGVSIPHNVTTKITNLEVDEDTANILDSVNNKLVIPESGYYSLDFFCTITMSSNNGRQAYSSIRVNGTQVKFGTRVDAAGSNILRTVGSLTSIASIKLVKGDEIEFYMYQNNNGGTTHSTGSARDAVQFTLRKLAQPQTLLETETVAARYTSNSGQSVGSNTVIEFEDIDYDTHNAYDTTTGVYTVPVKGKYAVYAGVYTQSRSWSAGNGFELKFEKNGTVVKTNIFRMFGTISTSIGMQLYDVLDLDKGDTIEVLSGTLTVNLSTNGFETSFSIIKIK